MRSTTQQLSADDGHHFSLFGCAPARERGRTLILLHEIFGVTSHIRELAQRFADEGYTALAPALFDRIEPGLELAYTEHERGRELIAQLQPEQTLHDIGAVIASRPKGERIAAIGYCWGGSIAYLAASELPLDAAVAYYGTRIQQMLERKPRCPLLLHFGARDHLISAPAVAEIRAANPDAECHIYADAGHAFNCDQRASFHAPSADLARERTLVFLRAHLG
ncbi:MAG: dienelactone hydrolase family protein [Gammaproteobacteria bacterium]|nr:dienelactone hydrolase family protein [Gammaproteobacteria bacterium]